MEANEVTEELPTTMDTENIPPKDPSAEDPQELPTENLSEPPISEAPLEAVSESHIVSSTFQEPLATHTSETPVEPVISETPLEPPASESPMVSTSSETPLEAHPSETLEPFSSESPLEHPIPQSPLETHISETPEEDPLIQSSLPGHVSVSSSDAPKEDFPESSTSGALWTKRSIQFSEAEPIQKHFLSGLSPPAHLYTSSKQKKGEDEEGVDDMDRTAYTTQPGHQLGKKKGKKGVGRNTVHTVVPADQAEVVDMIKARHREEGGAQVNLFQWEKTPTLNAMQTGLYIGWRCPHYLWDCFQIRDDSKCFCGHLLKEHKIISDLAVPCKVSQCHCHMFCFIPSRPEEVGEFWLKRRTTFDPKSWRALCRCKHSHEDHAAAGSHACRVKDCCCSCFESNFLCAACDRRWEEHETFFETEETRRRGGRPHGTDTVNTWHKPL
ncbi:protein FAM221B [Erinaceus europaeus]|uniref:Protein FAM221B n=1 Tax=Erinaceus europaeus TaxID=9365 RepID=A0ABM3Y285_ERIEU|nr:protein FAM221B [Erinaceus europaeus]